MNLFDATEISIEGKDVQKIEINDQVVWEKNTEPYLKSLILSTSSQRIDAWKQLAVTVLAKDQHNDGFPDALVTVNCTSTFIIEDILEIDENLTVETNDSAFLISNNSNTVLPISIPFNSNMELFTIRTSLNSGTLYKQYTLNGTTVTLGTSTDLNAVYWSFEDGVYYFGDDGDSIPDGITSFDLGLAPGTDVSISRNFLGNSVVYQESFTGTTDNRGYLDINYMPKQRGHYTFYAVAEDITSNGVSVTVTTPVELGDIGLVSDKDIISSYDHESALLTATVLDTNDDPVEGELVTFEVVGGEVLGSEVTDASGECSVYYVGKGTGDLNIQCSCRMFLSEIYELEDVIKYDNASINKTADYTSTNTSATLTYDSENKHYILTNQQSSSFGFMSLNNILIGNDVEISVDICIPSENASNVQPRLTIMNNSSMEGVGLNIRINTGISPLISLRKIVPNSDGNAVSANSYITASRGNWYTLKLKVNNNVFTGEIYDGNTLLNQVSSTVSNIISDASNIIGIQHCYTLNAVCYWKNLKITSL